MLVVHLRLSVFVAVDTGDHAVVRGHLMAFRAIELLVRTRPNVECVVEDGPLPSVGSMARFAARRKSAPDMVWIGRSVVFR